MKKNLFATHLPTIWFLNHNRHRWPLFEHITIVLLMSINDTSLFWWGVYITTLLPIIITHVFIIRRQKGVDILNEKGRIDPNAIDQKELEKLIEKYIDNRFIRK